MQHKSSFSSMLDIARNALTTRLKGYIILSFDKCTLTVVIFMMIEEEYKLIFSKLCFNIILFYMNETIVTVSLPKLFTTFATCTYRLCGGIGPIGMSTGAHMTTKGTVVRCMCPKKREIKISV